MSDIIVRVFGFAIRIRGIAWPVDCILIARIAGQLRRPDRLLAACYEAPFDAASALGYRSAAGRMAAMNGRKWLFADRGAMRFRAVTSQELPEIRGAQWPLSSPAATQALARQRPRRARRQLFLPVDDN